MWGKAKIKNTLDRMAKNWNPDYWIFVANGNLCLMRKKSGERAILPTGSVDHKYLIGEYPGIDADGGDW